MMETILPIEFCCICIGVGVWCWGIWLAGFMLYCWPSCPNSWLFPAIGPLIGLFIVLDIWDIIWLLICGGIGTGIWAVNCDIWLIWVGIGEDPNWERIVPCALVSPGRKWWGPDIALKSTILNYTTHFSNVHCGVCALCVEMCIYPAKIFNFKLEILKIQRSGLRKVTWLETRNERSRRNPDFYERVA